MKPYIPYIIVNTIFAAMGIALYVFEDWNSFFILWIIGILINGYLAVKK